MRVQSKAPEQVAIIYDRVNKWGGAERVLLALNEIFPNADLVTSVYSKTHAPWAEVFPRVTTSFLDSVPQLRSRHHFVPFLMPLAFETLSYGNYKTVISVTSEAAKGIITPVGTRHICYCLTPTRYLWSGYDEYFRSPGFRKLASPAIKYLKRWDSVAARRPDTMVAISKAVQSRIRQYYRRSSQIIFPPVSDLFFSKPVSNKKDDFFLLVSRLVPYKKTELAIEAFNRLGKKLYIVGEGSEKKRLTRLADKNISFLGKLTDLELLEYYSKCKALVFPQEEDFGLTAVEAQAAGAPVIAYGAGGSLDSVIDGQTGILFDLHSADKLTDAVKRFEKKEFDVVSIRANARRFSKDIFQRKFLEIT